MERIKSINWKLFTYWFVIMSLMNAYLIPKFINHNEINLKRILIGVGVALVIAFIMGLLSVPKADEEEQ